MKEILEQYINEGYRWIYKYKNNNFKDNPEGYLTRIFYIEPWPSLDAGMNWVDIPSCLGQKDKLAKLVEINIEGIVEPMKISDYIKMYLQ